MLASAKQTGLIALLLVPASVLCLGPRSFRGLALWAVATLAVVTLFADPLAYIFGLQHPETSTAAIRLEPFTRLTANLGFVASPSGYYWLSFSRHAEPLAPALARLHYVLTPAYLTLFAASALAALGRGDLRRLLLLVAPAALLLTLMLPTDAAWRFHVLAPLVCALVACEVPALPGLARMAVLVAAFVAASRVAWPARTGADYALDLGDLLFWNPAARQSPGFYRPERIPRRILTLRVGAPTTLTRRVWLAPGRWRVIATGLAPVGVSLDDSTVLAGVATAGDVAIRGYVHRLVVALPEGASLRSLSFLPLADDHP
jgi:hypothetical protein